MRSRPSLLLAVLVPLILAVGPPAHAQQLVHRLTLPPFPVSGGPPVVARTLALHGHLLATADDETGRIRLWDLRTRRERPSPLSAHSGARTLAFSPDGRTL